MAAAPKSDPIMYEPTSSEMATFFRKDAHTKARELLLTSRLTHDLMIAAAARGYDLLVYAPTVDSDGFDLVVDDRDRLLPLQLKSVLSDAKTGAWNIHRKMLRPEIWHLDDLGFESSPCGEGRGGGVILIEVTVYDSAVSVKYSYTDILVLTAFWLGALTVVGRGRAAKALAALRRGLIAEPGGTVAVPRSAFLQAKSHEHLLALMGMHSRYYHGWTNNLFQLARRETNVAPLDVLKELIADQLAFLCVLPNTIKPFKRAVTTPVAS